MFIKIECSIGTVWVNSRHIVTIDTNVKYDGWELALAPHAKYSYVDVYRNLNPGFEETLQTLAAYPPKVESIVWQAMVELGEGLVCNE